MHGWCTYVPGVGPSLVGSHSDHQNYNTLTSWWLSQPIWKNMSQICNLPQSSGWKFQNNIWNQPPSFKLGVIISTFICHDCILGRAGEQLPRWSCKTYIHELDPFNLKHMGQFPPPFSLSSISNLGGKSCTEICCPSHKIVNQTSVKNDTNTNKSVVTPWWNTGKGHRAKSITLKHMKPSSNVMAIFQEPQATNHLYLAIVKVSCTCWWKKSG